MYREEDEEEWPKWTALRGTAMTLDNMPLNEVFARIQTQLEILRKRPIFDPKKYALANDRKVSTKQYLPVITEPAPDHSHRREDGPDTHTHDFVPTGKYEEFVADLEIRLQAIEAAANREPSEPQPVIVQQPSGDSEGLILQLTDRIQQLEQLLADNTQENKEKLALMESSLNEQNFRLTNKVDDLSSEISSLKQSHAAELANTHLQIQQFIQSVNVKLVEQMGSISEALKQTQGFLDQFSKLSTTVDKTVVEVEGLEHKVSDIADHKSVIEQRIVSVELKQSKANQSTEEVRVLLTSLKDTSTRTNVEVDTLKQVKANREELQTKADVSVAMAKADQTEIDRLDELARELSRRITGQARDQTEALHRSQKECEKKIDTVAQWCFKHLSKDAQSQPLNSMGGDIGRIKCLVCDQPIKQQTEQDVVFGGPQLTHVIKSRKQQSPPRQHTLDHPRAHAPISIPLNVNNYHGNINNYHIGDGIGGVDGEENKLKNKLSKLLATPTPIPSHAQAHASHSQPHSLSQSQAQLLLVQAQSQVLHGSIQLPQANQQQHQQMLSDSLDINDELPPNANGNATGDGDVIPIDVATQQAALDAPAAPFDSPKTRPITAPRVVATKQPTLVTSLSNPLLGATGSQVTQTSQLNGRDYIVDTHTKPGTGTNTVNVGDVAANYFKDLEGKFSGTGGRRLTAAEIAAHRERESAATAKSSGTGNGGARPGSAPMKRTHNPAKLQSLGKPMNNGGTNSDKNPLLPPF